MMLQAVREDYIKYQLPFSCCTFRFLPSRSTTQNQEQDEGRKFVSLSSSYSHPDPVKMSCNRQVRRTTRCSCITTWSYDVLQEITSELESLNTHIRTLNTGYWKLVVTIHDQTTVPSLEALEMELKGIVDRIETEYPKYRDLFHDIATQPRELKELLLIVVMNALNLTRSGARAEIDRWWKTVWTWANELSKLCCEGHIRSMRGKIALGVVSQRMSLVPGAPDVKELANSSF